MTTEVKRYPGRCFCGAVELAVTGDSVGMGYCHCNSCRVWSAGPVNAFTLWHAEAVETKKGADQVASYHRTENSVRKWCKVCGGHLMTEHPLWKLIDVYAAILPGLHFEPGVHVNYESTVLPMRDGLPKHRDFPAELGGTGQLVDEAG